MKKSLLGIVVGIIWLSLLITGRGQLSADEVSEIEQAKTAESELLMDHQHKIVEPAVFPGEGSIVTIEDGAVPLAADLPVKKEIVTIEEAAVPLAAASAGKNTETAEVSDMEMIDLGGGVLGYYDEAAAKDLLSQVNMLRMDVENTTKLSPELNAIARERALACVSDFSHDGMQTSAECMATGQESGAAVVSSWYASRIHRGYISDSAYTQAGTACIKYDSGSGQLQTIWILVMN